MTQSNASRPPALLVGTGFGCRIPLPALRAAGFDVVGLVGTDAERTKRRAEANGVPQTFTDLDDAIARTGAAVVVIATPPHTHGPLTKIAISRGCHVLCEKPFAKDVAEAREMLKAAERAGVVHMVGHQFRWQPERAIVGRAIKDGLIGEPRFVTLIQYFSLVASPDAKMPQWWFDAEVGGGWLGAAGSHLVDQVRAWLGEFVSVSAALPMVSARSGVAEDSFSLRFNLANGAEGILQQTAGAWGPGMNVARVAGTRGTVWIDGNTVKLADRDGTRDLPLPEDLALPSSPPPGEDFRQRPLQQDTGPYTQLCLALRAAMEGKPSPTSMPAPTFADGIACMEVLDAIRKSAAEKGALVTIR